MQPTITLKIKTNPEELQSPGWDRTDLEARIYTFAAGARRLVPHTQAHPLHTCTLSTQQLNSPKKGNPLISAG